MNIVVIGGGAAGFFAAITAAEFYADADVILLEAAPVFLGKVKVSGGGRCNVTHACFEPEILVKSYPRGGLALRGAFTRFNPSDTVKWYQQRGVALKTEVDGRMFPVTDSSQTIIDCLMGVANQVGVELRANAKVMEVRRGGLGYQVFIKNAFGLKCDRLILATGSHPSGYNIAKSLGHTIETPVPSLFTFNIPDSPLLDLAGVSVESVKVDLITGGNKLVQSGPILITHWGFSGPVILRLSAWGARILYDSGYVASLIINWIPDYNPESLKKYLVKLKRDWNKKIISGLSPFKLPKRLWQRLVELAGINPEQKWADLSNESLDKLMLVLSKNSYEVRGKGVFKDEFVTCGGVSLKEVNFKTMESKICRGLYLVGEVLDIDGITGGFNFQSAWTTGYIAGLGVGGSG